MIGYTLGKKEVDINSLECYAQKDEINNKYFILVHLDGQLYNPLNNMINRKICHGIVEWKFQIVTKSVFDRYIRFLETSNSTHFEIASREFLNA
jgi:hypothetical protein